MGSKGGWMAQTSLEVSSSSAHYVFALSEPPVSFDIHPPRHSVSYESTANLDMPLPSSFSVLACQRGQRLRQFAAAHSQKVSLIVSVPSEFGLRKKINVLPPTSSYKFSVIRGSIAEELMQQKIERLICPGPGRLDANC